MTETRVEYITDDARNPPSHLTEASVATVDFAWQRPKRAGKYVTYPTLGFEELTAHIDAVYECLTDGGWAIFDADDWLLPRLLNYLRESWGDVASTYDGGGFRRVGSVTYEGHPGGGEYFTNGGYSVVFAHKGETDRKSSVSSRQVTSRPSRELRDHCDWGTMKPYKPYQRWVTDIINNGETVLVPHAGTAPAAIAMLKSDTDADVVCIDAEKAAKEAFRRRRTRQVDGHEQVEL